MSLADFTHGFGIGLGVALGMVVVRSVGDFFSGLLGWDKESA